MLVHNADDEKQKFVILADHSNDFIGMCGPDLVLFYVNPVGLTMIGLDSLEQTRRTPLEQFFFPDDRKFIHDEFFPLVLREGKGEVEIRFRHFKTGQAMWMHYTVVRLADAESRIVELGMISRNITERKRMEETIRDNEEWLRSILDRAPGAVFTKDRAGRYQFMNPECARVLGTSPSDGVGKTDHDLLQGALADQLRSNDLDVWASDVAQTREETVPLSDGLHTFLSEKFLLRHSNGTPYALCGIAMDITSRRRLEEALRASEERLRLAQCGANSGVFDWDVTTGKLVWTPELEALWGLEPGTVRTYDDFKRRVHTDDIAALEAKRDGAVSNHQPFDLEFRIIHPCGEVRWLSSQGRAFYNEAGEPVRVVGTNMDITERKQGEEELRESEARFRTLADHISQLAWMADPTGWIFWYNHRWYDYTGTTFADMQGWGWEKVHAADRLPHVLPKWREALQKGEPWEDTFPLRGKDGQYRWFLSRAQPIRDEEGTVVRWFGTNTDITEQRAAEEALRQLKAVLEHRVKERTHELERSEQQLRALAAQLNLIEQRERKRLAAELHDHLQQMLVFGRLQLGQGKRVAAAAPGCAEVMEKVDEVLSEALQYTRTLVAELSPLELREHGLAAGLKWLAEYMKKRGLMVTVHVPPTIECELPEDQSVLLFQSVRELLINSAKHAETGQATVMMEQRDGVLRIQVRDQGTGFDLTTDGIPSGGLSSKVGLFSIHERMRSLGGSFEIQSAPGQGTSATLSLPYSSRTTSEELRETLPGPPSNYESGLATRHTSPVEASIRVLLVDDHQMIRQGLRSMLEGYSDLDLIGEAADGDEAIKLVDQLEPHVVVMDINMPKLNGIEATAIIKSRHSNTVVIGLSVNAGGDNHIKMLQAGARVLLTKEAALEQLYEAIRQAVQIAPPY